MFAFSPPRQLPPNPSMKLRASQPVKWRNCEIVTLLFTGKSKYNADSCTGDSTQHNQHILPSRLRYSETSDQVHTISCPRSNYVRRILSTTQTSTNANPSIKLRANQPTSQPASQLNEQTVTLLFSRGTVNYNATKTDHHHHHHQK
jgi:hypothetical protein